MITVNQLLELCEEQKSKGNGNKRIFISMDDEGNAFHGLFYGFTSKEEDIKAYHDMGCVDEVENVILLG